MRRGNALRGSGSAWDEGGVAVYSVCCACMAKAALQLKTVLAWSWVKKNAQRLAAPDSEAATGFVTTIALIMIVVVAAAVVAAAAAVGVRRGRCARGCRDLAQ